MHSVSLVADRATSASAAPGVELTRRQYNEHVTGGPNAHAYWYKARNHLDGPVLGPLQIVLNYLVIHLCKHLPSLALKRWILRRLGMRLGHNVTIASGVTLDYFFPELIEIGPDTIVGMNAMLLTHEFLHDRLRTGKVSIGRGCLVGANSTLLAGVTLAHGVTVSAMSLVHKCLPANVFAGGVPVRVLR